MSKNALIGDFEAIDLPDAAPDEKELIVEKQMANYAKTEEFARIQQHCAERIAFYQAYLPNGLEVGLEVQPTTEDWRVANRVIGEFKLLMGMYDVATQAVEDVRA